MSLNGSLVGVTSHITPLPAGEGLGEGPLSCGIETVRKEALLNLWVLWEINLPSVRDKPPHASNKQPHRGNLTFHSPPYGGGAGGGASVFLAQCTYFISNSFISLSTNKPLAGCALTVNGLRAFIRMTRRSGSPLSVGWSPTFTKVG